MLSKIRAYLRQHHVGLLALFVALGGTAAWAADGPLAGQNTVGSEDIIGNEVKSDDIGNGRIFNLDVADEILTGQKMKDGTVTGSDVDETTLDKTELDNTQFASAQTTSCDPNSPTVEVICASTSLTVEGGSDIFVSATGTFHGTAAGADTGRCAIESNNGQFATLSHATDFGQTGDAHNAAGRGDGIAVSGAVSLASTGEKTITLTCLETEGNILLEDAQITAVQFGR